MMPGPDVCQCGHHWTQHNGASSAGLKALAPNSDCRLCGCMAFCPGVLAPPPGTTTTTIGRILDSKEYRDRLSIQVLLLGLYANLYASESAFGKREDPPTSWTSPPFNPPWL